MTLEDKRKINEIREKQQEEVRKQFEEEQQIHAQISQLENLVRKFLTKEALVRYGNLKTAHTEKALKVLSILGQMIQNGQIQEPISDTRLREMLQKLEPKKKEFKIKRI